MSSPAVGDEDADFAGSCYVHVQKYLHDLTGWDALTVTEQERAFGLAGVDGPYAVLLSADAYTKVSETSDHGYPIREHLNRLVTAISSGRLRSTARSYYPLAEAISTCSWALTCRSAT